MRTSDEDTSRAGSLASVGPPINGRLLNPRVKSQIYRIRKLQERELKKDRNKYTKPI